jgi:hypothetical protein
MFGAGIFALMGEPSIIARRAQTRTPARAGTSGNR